MYAQDRLDEADELARLAEQYSAPDDVTSQALWRSVRAKVLARRGETEGALPLAREAVKMLRTTDALVWQGNALADEAEVLRLLDRDTPAVRRLLDEALELFERKGAVVSAGKLVEGPGRAATAARA